jgi:hypothetical protein
MIQFDHILAVNGSMISHGSLTDHTNYVNMNSFEWDPLHEYWKPKFTSGDKITLQMTTVRAETPQLVLALPSPPPPRTLPPKVRIEFRSLGCIFILIRYKNVLKKDVLHQNSSK